MKSNEDIARIGHMLEAAHKALNFSQGKTRSDLDHDELLCLALVRLLEVLGEAAARVSPGMRANQSEIPWPKIVGMRNRLIHGYDQVDLEVLWQTLVQDLRPLAEALERILSTDDPP